MASTRAPRAAASAVQEPEPVEVLPFHAAAPRMAVPDAVLGDPDFPEVELHADKGGIVRPQTSDEVRLADALRLPVIRKE